MIETKHLFTMPVEVEMPLQMVGRTPIGERRIAKVTSGSFAGPELNGKILPGGAATGCFCAPTAPFNWTSGSRSKPTMMR